MGRNQCKKAENTRNQNASPPTGDRSSSSAREQGLTEDECDELTESGFRRWIIRIFCELKDHVLTQCKETKNLERRFNEMLTRMDNLEKNISVPECDEEDESKLENTLQDIIQENFPNLARQANIQLQEIQRTPQRYSSRRATPRHIIVRFTRVEMKEKMLRAAREKVRVTHKGKPIRLTADLSAETLQARREWGPTFNILKENNFQPRISYPAKLSFISEGKIKFFANKQVLRDYITTRPALQELLKEALHMDGNNQYQPFRKHTKSWYTLMEGQEPIARKVVEQGMFVKHCKVEVYLTELKLCENGNMNNVVTRRFSKADTIDTIEKEIRKIFNIPDEKETRLWNKYMSNTFEPLNKPDSTIQDAGLYQGQVLVIEQKNEDGTWPRGPSTPKYLTPFLANRKHTANAVELN
ncbi:LINE-1 retrotransposable element ORF1 protein [Plecturocebus cupreus]